MIERYSVPRMTAIWADESRFSRWLEIEILAVEARAAAGLVPPGDLERIRSRASFDVGRIGEIEAEVKHDVIAFLTSVSESVGPESRHIHYGMTSSDILDTALAMQIRDSAALISGALAAYRSALASLVERTRGIPCIGRTHGMHAEPTTLALKFAGHLAECDRAASRFGTATAQACVGKLSGAVGTYAHLDPSVEEYVLGRLGLGREEVATQVVARDRHAAFLFALAMIGAALERFATEVRNLQRTETGEVEEGFSKGQKGSSAMPHKRNPVQSERLCGFARLLRGCLVAGLENTALWHERDISHSSVERFILPDACGVAMYSLERAAELAGGLRIIGSAVERNLAAGGDRFASQAVMLELVDRGRTREEAYAAVQAAAARAVEAGSSFLDEALADPVLGAEIPGDLLKSLCDVGRHVRHEDEILARIVPDPAGPGGVA